MEGVRFIFVKKSIVRKRLKLENKESGFWFEFLGVRGIVKSLKVIVVYKK